ncbi:hypothetical protein AC1031_011578 [Aphanomyces cochlioides]|nr:hypothetical protein AC1031_011578 [Aphanomyces cochlioides]
MAKAPSFAARIIALNRSRSSHIPRWNSREANYLYDTSHHAVRFDRNLQNEINRFKLAKPMLAEYLTAKFEAIDADQNASWIASSVQRSHMQDNLQEIFCSSRLERLPWLLDVWDRWLPQKWSGRCRQECRYLALEHQQWDLLIDFTKSVPEPHLKYKEDMVYAAQYSLLDAVEWLGST